MHTPQNRPKHTNASTHCKVREFMSKLVVSSKNARFKLQKPKAKFSIPMCEALEVTKCEKCGKTLAIAEIKIALLAF